ncbi:peptidyl-prolyl cis-trans isomerase-like [Apium graveolens]|uniref:peptidyl-prolyl cis-trans isomerase-like n=1 Tax=Apium graveolens TaxID=4045 RepID=UPI003D78D359
MKKMANPKVFMDINIAGAPAGRVVFELFADITPITAENFRALCTGEKGIGKISGKPLHYKRLGFNYVEDGYILSEGNGESIYGGHFKCENFLTKHAEPGILSMGVSGQGSGSGHNSRFFITVCALPQYDGRCVAVGKVIDGMDVVNAIFKKGSTTVKDAIIVDCGQLIDNDEDDIEPY